jgi:glyoxylase-like metal-dependent hydrolase (beta-lactamase superfamily II)
VREPVSDTYEVLVVRYASRMTTRGLVYLNHHLYGEPDSPIGMDYYIWVIRNAHRTIVVDTGYSETGGNNRRRGHLIHPRDALRRLHVEPAETTVVLTHAHYDHAGNVDLFTDSKVIVPQAEYDFWTGDCARRFQFRHTIEENEIDHLRTVHEQGRMVFHQGHAEIAPGVELIELGGHSPGQAILTVNTAEGLVLLTSDATHYYEELEQDMPFLVVADLEAMYRGFDYMNQLIADRDAILVPGHDPAVLDRHRRLDGPMGEFVAVIGGQQPEGATA